MSKLRANCHTWQMIVVSIAVCGVLWGASTYVVAAEIEEIIVTAQKRQESLQDIPISVQVISGEILSQQNQISLETLSMTVPALNISPSGPSHEIYLRGIGSGQNHAFDQSVATFIDDVYHGRSRSTAAAFIDLERIEVLKGPQSTFFGNSAIAGALNVVTRKPGDKFDASLRALYGEDGQYAVEGTVGGPLSDTFAARLALVTNGLDGYIENVNTGKDAPNEENYGGRLTLLFQPSETLNATLKIETSVSNRTGTGFAQPFQITNCPSPQPEVPDWFGGDCAPALALGIPIGNDNNQNSNNEGMGADFNTTESVLTINYDQWGHTFTSVTAYYEYEYDLHHDNDGTPLFLTTRGLPEDYEQFSQEIRVASPTNQPIEYLAGFYYQNDDLDSLLETGFGFVIPAFFPPGDPAIPFLPLGLAQGFSQDEDIYSVFGSVKWNATDRLSLGAGLRGSWVDKDYTLNLFYGSLTGEYGGIVPFPAGVQNPGGYFGQGVPGMLSGSRSDDDWTPSARIQYDITPEAMVYFSYANGFKSGGFNALETSGVAANVPFDPESVDAYEVGLKSAWFDNRLLLNLAVFRNDYTNLQVAFWEVPASGPAVSNIRNAAESRSQGVELEAKWQVSENFRLAGNLTYLDAYYVSYPDAGASLLGLFNAAVTGDTNLNVQDLSGRPTQYSPDWSGSLTATFNTPLPGGYQLTAELNPYFSSGYHIIFLIDEDWFWQDSYARLDGRLTLEPANGRWAIDVLGKNLTDALILTAYGSPRHASKQHTRNVAVQVRYQW